MKKKMAVFIVLFFTITSLAHAFELKGNIIIDDGGRHIQVGRVFNRIISLYPAHTENIVAMGGANYLVGISRSDTYPPFILNKKRFSYHFGPERFLAVNPDLILIRPMIDFAYHSLVKRLESYNITVVSLQATNVRSLYTYWRILGRLIGKEKRAEEMISDFNRFLSIFHSIDKKIRNKKRVYFESMHKKLKTFSPNSISIFVLNTAGGINVAKDAVSDRGTNIADYGKERILSHANDIDVFISQYGMMNRVHIKDILNEPGFEIIKAIKHHNVYIVDEHITSRPTIRLLLGIYEIGHILYPQYYKKDLKAEIDKVIAKYYSK